jgi:hypothetical protein
MNPSRTRRGGRALAVAVAAVTTALAATLLTSSGVATAHGSAPPVPPPPAAPTRADQIQNIDQVRTAIKAYYGDTPTPGTDPVSGTPTTLHLASPTGAYAEEMANLEARAQSYLKHPRATQHRRHHHHDATSSAKKAIVLDVDDTTLNTYDYEIYSNFAYNPTTNAAFVNSAAFPAVFGMPALVAYAQAKHYTLFFLTGRPETQRAGTVANLSSVGYPAVPADQLYLKDQTKPYLAACAPACTTIQYKSLTRKLIESRGYDIVANFGDQFSDLEGGYADKGFKLPNPMYFLP